MTADAGWLVDSCDEPADGWVVWLGGTFVREADGKPRGGIIPTGAIAGVAPDGRRRWTLSSRPCFSLESASTRCDGEATVTPGGDVTRSASHMELLSRTTGEVVRRIELTVPLDDSNPGNRVLRQKEGRLIVDTGNREFVVVDVRAGAVEPVTAGEVIGWCKPVSRSVDLREPNGDEVEAVRVKVSRAPCSTDGGPVALADVADGIRRALIDDEDQFVKAGRWRLWIEGDGIRGFEEPS